MRKYTELIRQLGAAALITGILYLFYNTVFVLAAFFLIFPFCRKYMKKQAGKRRRDELLAQFKDMLISLTAAMRTGYSVENGLKEALGEMKLTHGEDSAICKELSVMIGQLKIGVPVEEVFFKLAQRSGLEDASVFASVFKIARRSGGDMAQIMKKTSEDIAAKVDTKNEIAVIISAKRLEQNIMMLMPAGIIVYMRISSSGLLDPLYGNAAGVLIMSGCLMLYALAWYMGRRITDIEV